jgi:hypothetical protein
MFLLSDFSRLTLGLDQGFDAYLRFFREGCAGERLDLTRDLTRLGACSFVRMVLGEGDPLSYV